MSLRFFADHCVSNFVVKTLRDAGHEVLQLREHMPTDASDTEVIGMAQELNTILISLNGDFANMVTYPPQDYKGIVSLQVRNRPEIIPQIVERLRGYLSQHDDMAHYRGKLFLVEAHRLRVRG